MTEFKLREGSVYDRLKPGKFSVGAPVQYSPEFPYGVIMMNTNPQEHDKGRLTIDGTGRGSKLSAIRIWRQDDPLATDFEPVPIQAHNLIFGREATVSEPVFEEPVYEIGLRRTEAGAWVVRSLAAAIKSANGFNRFIQLITADAYAKQKFRNYEEAEARQLERALARFSKN